LSYSSSGYGEPTAFEIGYEREGEIVFEVISPNGAEEKPGFFERADSIRLFKVSSVARKLIAEKRVIQSLRVQARPAG
jgi:hypothetical protein